MVDRRNGRLYPLLEEVSEEERSPVRTNKVVEGSSSEPKKPKSLLIAYILWFFGGWFGLHHMYLNRDAHAFVYWITAGAYFGIGAIRDLWMLPHYVRDANEDQEYLEELVQRMRKEKSPDNSWVRSWAFVIIGDVFGYMVVYSLPTELLDETIRSTICALVVPFAVACGIHLVGNIGRYEGTMKWPLIGAYITCPIYFIGDGVFCSTMCSFLAFNWWGKKWKRRYERPKSFWKRFWAFFFGILIYCSLWSSYLYFNCTVTDKDGQEIKCREAARHFFNSPFWQEFKSVMHDLYQYYRFHGFSGFWAELVSSLDPTGEYGALKVLGLNDTASQEDITSTYRRLSRTWHPDRHRDLKAKEEAAQKFMQIQEAYEILSNMKNSRMRKNKLSQPEPSSGGFDSKFSKSDL